jgi:hypothetical protein
VDGDMPIIQYGNHTIEVRLDRSTGEETILYDGKVMSSRISMRGGSHKFSVKEEGEGANYEVKIKVKGGLLGTITGIGFSLTPTVEVFRNGQKIYST